MRTFDAEYRRFRTRFDLGAGSPYPVETVGNGPVQTLSTGCQAQPIVLSFEQGRTEMTFKIGDKSAYRWLRHTQIPSGKGKTVLSSRLFKYQQCIQNRHQLAQRIHKIIICIELNYSRFKAK